jgi:small subunit ribosomal protein S16
VLTIRLSRQGRRNLPHYKLVVQQKHASPKSGRYVALLGHYDPQNTENTLVFDKEKTETFLKNGAEPSDTVARLLKKAGVAGVEKYMQKYTHKVNLEKQKALEEAAKKEAAEREAAKKAAEEAKAAAEAAKAAAAEAAAAPAEEPAKEEAAAEEAKTEESPKEEAPAEDAK